MFYSILVGEEPDSVLLKKEGKQNQVKMVDLLASLTVQPSSRGAPFLLGPQRQNVGLVPTVHHGRKDSPNRDH
ncbi:hypothetical protein C4D60_Mb00t18090 [Musa balbisiana]|uniref:Uncharacterized protein n=1 Tax=Musa balbisiana TaxID=52838 RepID=A0A4S8I720_MUSBA|nr:hypothetical protein C4D60_Mb00t18090 [Musa balbisiana]